MAKEKSAPVSYDESKIKTLSSLEHIRLRSGMYIGRLGDGKDPDDGIYVLLKEVIDNSIDEFIMGNGNRIQIQVKEGSVKIRDFGRGIPLGKVVECVSVINTGAKYSDDVFQFSVGLNGVGTKAVNALSSHFRVIAFREGKYKEAIFTEGKLLKEKQGKAPDQPDGTYVEFTPDSKMFVDYEYNLEFIRMRMKNYACLNSGLTLEFNGEKFVSKNGLRDLLEDEVGNKALYGNAHYRGEKLEIAFTHIDGYGENYFSFVNGQYTSDGGSHQSAFREGFLKGVNEFFKKNYSGVDVREGFVGAVAIKIKDPVFESQTKNKLGNSNVKSWIVQETKEAVLDFLFKHSDEAKMMLNKILNSERMRTELNTVRKEAKEQAKKISLNIPKLKDCKFHLGGKNGDETMIFLTEGDSAAGSMTATRDVMTQAIFALRGKILNVQGKKKSELYKNEELYNLMMALGIENGIEELRYNKVVIATDADNDGFHIRNLLMTYFFTYFEELVLNEHLYILETPLFRVRNKKEAIYCYNEKERDEATAKIKGAEVTRFKGLGEISPKEFGPFIGSEIKLQKVTVSSIRKMQETLEFYMGKNTPDRKKYIMENLI